MADESLTFRAFGTDVSAGRMFGDLGDKADDASTSIHDLGDESKDLDARLAETRIHVRELITEFERTGDVSLFRDIRRDRSTIGMIESMRREIHGVTDEAEDLGHTVSQATSKGILDGLGSLPSQLKGAGIVAAIAIAPFLAPVLGAAVGGAVLGGVGLGGVIGGVFAAAQDQRIKDAGGLLGENFMGGFKDAGRIFINPILDQMGTLQRAEDVFLADFASGLASLAPLVRPLAQGLEGLAENLDLGEAFADAEPALRAIAQELPEIGAAIGDALTAIGDESDGATMGLIELLHVTEDLIRGGGEFIGWLSGVFEGMVRAGNATTGWALGVIDLYDSLSFLAGGPANIALDKYRGHLQGLHDDTQSLIDGLGHAKDSGDDWRGSLAQQARAAKEAADETKAFDDAIKSLFGILMGLEEAQVRYNQDLIAARKELKEGTKTLAINSEEGLKNREVLDGLINDIERVREANIANHMPVERANQLYEQQVQQLIELAVKLGFSRSEVERFARALRDVPATVAAQVKTPGLTPALQHAIDLDRMFDRLDGRVVTSYQRTVFGDYRAGERNPSGRASGGPVMAGTSYWVGENGPEIVTFGRNGTVIPAGKSAAMASGGSVDVNVMVNAAGAADDLKSLVLKWLRVDAGFRATVAGYVGSA
jgi:hypothetical protein